MDTEIKKSTDRLEGKIVRVDILNPISMGLGNDDIAISMQLDTGDIAYSVTTQKAIKYIIENTERFATFVGEFFDVTAKPDVKHLHAYEIFFGDETPFQ
jgi:hypothetical protein